MKLNDDDIVAWVCHGQRNTTTVAAARKMLRAAYPDWVDDKIEQELFALIVSGTGVTLMQADHQARTH